MLRVTLSDQERWTLQALVAHPSKHAVQRCAQALLWLDAGTTVAEVARRLGVYRSTIYKWRRQYHSSNPTDLTAWLTQRLHHGQYRPLIVLSDAERKTLEDLVARATEAAVVRRAQALLWLHTGEKVSEVAQRLRVSRYAIYTWVQSFQDTHTSDIRQRLTVSPPYGQSQAVRARLEPLIRAVLDHDPRELGYDATAWTATLLSQYLWKEHGITASRQRINPLLRRLRQQRYTAQDQPVRQRPVKEIANGAGKRCDGKSL